MLRFSQGAKGESIRHLPGLILLCVFRLDGGSDIRQEGVNCDVFIAVFIQARSGLIDFAWIFASSDG